MVSPESRFVDADNASLKWGTLLEFGLIDTQIGGPVLVVSFLLQLDGVFENGAGPSGS